MSLPAQRAPLNHPMLSIRQDTVDVKRHWYSYMIDSGVLQLMTPSLFERTSLYGKSLFTILFRYDYILRPSLVYSSRDSITVSKDDAGSVASIKERMPLSRVETIYLPTYWNRYELLI